MYKVLRKTKTIRLQQFGQAAGVFIHHSVLYDEEVRNDTLVNWLSAHGYGGFRTRVSGDRELFVAGAEHATVADGRYIDTLLTWLRST